MGLVGRPIRHSHMEAGPIGPTWRVPVELMVRQTTEWWVWDCVLRSESPSCAPEWHFCVSVLRPAPPMPSHWVVDRAGVRRGRAGGSALGRGRDCTSSEGRRVFRFVFRGGGGAIKHKTGTGGGGGGGLNDRAIDQSPAGGLFWGHFNGPFVLSTEHKANDPPRCADSEGVTLSVLAFWGHSMTSGARGGSPSGGWGVLSMEPLLGGRGGGGAVRPLH